MFVSKLIDFSLAIYEVKHSQISNDVHSFKECFRKGFRLKLHCLLKLANNGKNCIQKLFLTYLQLHLSELEKFNNRYYLNLDEL